MFNVSNLYINMQIVHVLSKFYDLEVTLYDYLKSIYVVYYAFGHLNGK